MSHLRGGLPRSRAVNAEILRWVEAWCQVNHWEVSVPRAERAGSGPEDVRTLDRIETVGPRSSFLLGKVENIWKVLEEG